MLDGRAVKKKLAAPALKQEPVVVAAATVAPVAVASTAEDDDEDVDLLGLGKKLGQTCSILISLSIGKTYIFIVTKLLLIPRLFKWSITLVAVRRH